MSVKKAPGEMEAEWGRPGHGLNMEAAGVMEGGWKMATVLYLEMRSTHRAGRVQRGEGLNLGQERREAGSPDAGGHPGEGLTGSPEFGAGVGAGAQTRQLSVQWRQQKQR